MKLFEAANQYCKKATWKTLFLIKMCLFSIGIIVGLLLPDRFRMLFLLIFGILFLLTYIPLMIRFYKIWKNN